MEGLARLDRTTQGKKRHVDIHHILWTFGLLLAKLRHWPVFVTFYPADISIPRAFPANTIYLCILKCQVLLRFVENQGGYSSYERSTC